VRPQHGFLVSDSSGFVLIGSGVARDEARRERLEARDPLNKTILVPPNFEGALRPLNLRGTPVQNDAEGGGSVWRPELST
jgi:hypothetical protein